MNPGVTISISITRDDATPAVARLAEAMASEPLRQVMARGLENDIRAHLEARDTSHATKLPGVTRQHIHLEMAKATHGEALSSGVRISISHPAASLRYHGGTVFPVEARLLTIPIDPRHPAADPEAAQAYGNSARKFAHLRLVMFGRTGKGALLARARTNISFDRASHKKGQSGQKRVRNQGTIEGGGIFYWLVPSTTHQADRTLIPTDAVLIDRANQHAADYLSTAITP